jgi:hypothetical protein
MLQIKDLSKKIQLFSFEILSLFLKLYGKIWNLIPKKDNFGLMKQ